MTSDFFYATLISLASNIVFTVIALFVGILAIKLVDIVIFRKLDFQEELKNKNVAVAIFASSMLIFIAIIIVFGVINF